MQGTLYPIFTQNSRPAFVLGIVEPVMYPLKLSLELAVTCSTSELEELLKKRTYQVLVHQQKRMLSKREIQCIVCLIHGLHAGQIAETLTLKQTTVESYIVNIKNKLAAIDKSSLINTVFKEKILDQVIL